MTVWTWLRLLIAAANVALYLAFGVVWNLWLALVLLLLVAVEMAGRRRLRR